ncbi:hypothetical protein FEM48_Zijuj06G0068100 [Ziziphus jujuba var. spinosa]|uniref:Chorismate mutase n=1 Tax=Ziziphus jujuba var. spinosa TaxID=714518 RepID=A0A978V7T0_ZIZJJ|nr:hypothetical protein FEM48_Zijuj06G0068100 [Ziziphus jujuba var. spinosa]
MDFTVVMVLICVISGGYRNRLMAEGNSPVPANGMTLEAVRDSLIRQEDTIIFSLIERAKFPLNSPTYQQSYASIPGFSGPLIDFFVKQAEALQAKTGRYQNPEEHPFFPDDLPPSLVPPYDFPPILHPAANSINVNNKIWDTYFNQLLPLLAKPGDDGNYASTATSDLNCLQAISRRIHYGNFVAEVKFKDAPEDYEPAIRAQIQKLYIIIHIPTTIICYNKKCRSLVEFFFFFFRSIFQDRDALMKLLTFEAVEKMVVERVGKKTKTFAQEVTLNSTSRNDQKCKVDPSVVSQLYEKWIMPLTKLVEVEYLLRRLD